MDNFKRNYLKRTLSLVLAVIMIITLVPLGAFTALAEPADQPAADATSSATYYKKANWENRIKDKSRWPIGDNQRLVRVSTSDPVEMNDIDYDGNFVDANGRTVLRLVYKEKGAAATAVWYRALFNFGELDQFIDYDLSYLVGANDDAKIVLTPFNDREERMVDIGVARGVLTQQRKNLPINLVLKEGVTINTLGKKNYIVQMRLTDKNGVRVYSYAPKGTAMDYSTYTKTTSVSLEDKVNRLFIKGGLQNDGNDATNQEFFMSEFIANPEQYDDGSNLGIIRTQYMGQRSGTKQSPTVGGEPIAFTQAFDAKLLDYLKPDGKGNVAYVNVLENSRLKSKWSHDFGFKIKDFNKSADGKLAYLVIAPNAFQKDGVNKVEIEKHDQFTMIQGFYITAIDYVVDKAKFEDTFAGKTAGIDATRKLNYSTISGWTNPNKDGWVIFERDFADGYVANEGESYIIDTTTDPQGGQIMIKIGNDDAIIRRTQGYYTGSVLGNAGIEKIAKFTDGIYTFDLREGATVSAGDKLKVYMPYTKEHAGPVNFLEIHNGTKLNKGAATLKLLTNRKINMHLYKEGNKGHYVLKYTLADGTESSKKFEPKLTWKYDNKDKVMTGAANGATLSTGGNFYIDTEKLQPGADIFVESYDEKGNEIPEQKSWFKYKPIAQSTERVEGLTWTDHSDTSSILSVNKSLYTPYQVLFTNDYAEGTDDFYKDPRVLPDDNAKFNTDTIEFVGYTKYDGGKVRTIYDEGRTPKLIAKVQADEDEYNDKGELTKESAKKIMIPKEEIFDPNFNETSKEYTAYEYKVNLAKMLEYNSADKTDKSLTLLKDMKFVSNASDGSSLPSDYYETRVRARVLFDTTDGEFADKTKKAVKIVPDNIKFYGEDGYAANGFEGANVEANTGDKFPEAPKLEGKNFLGWVTEAGKTALGDKAVVTADAFNGLPKDQIFTNETPVTKHLVVYAVYSDEVTVTFDANEGKFGDGKDTTNVKVEGGNATAPTDPTRDGYEFKGWADKKDATEADADILKNVNAPKTVYAVWEKTEKTPLELTAPTPVEVKDLKGLTSDEIDKVKKAVVEANKDKGITEADVTVAEDGTVTVTKDGKTGTLTPDKTIKQKEVQNEFNPPKEPVPVDKIGQLTDEEIGKIKQAVKDANPDRNFKDDEITVEADGTVKINQGGKVGTIPADKTVVQKDTILELQAPEKTEVKDITNLTKEERDKVAAAVKTKNNLPNTATIDVDSKGNVTVTDGTKTGKLKAKDTVKPFTREDKPLNPPVQKVKVSDKTNLTEKEKQDVRDAIKAANPDLDFKDNEIQVDEDGTVTVPMGETKVGTIPGTATVEEITDADKTIKLLEPEKTVVADKTKLTPQEKTAVKEAVKKANPTLNLTNDEIEVAEDGSVTVTRGEDENQKVGQLSQEDTVVENLKKPEATALRDGSVVVTPKDDRTEELEITFGDAANPTTVTAKKENGKWILPAGTDPSIMIDETTGMVTIPAKMLKNNDEVKAKAKAGKLESEEATVNSNDETVPAAPTVVAEDDGSVKVTPPADADTKTVEIKYTDKDGHAQTLVATKENGKWTLPAGTDASITIDETTGVVALPKDKVKAGEKVTAKAKDANDNESAAGEATPVDKTDLKTEVAKNNNDAIKNSDKYKNAEQTKKDAYDAALDKAKKVLGDPSALQKDIDDALKELKDAEAALDGTAEEKPTITDGKAENDPSKTTTTVSGKTKPNTEVTIKLADGTEKKVTSDAEGKFTAEVTKQNKDAQITITPKDGTASTVTVTEKAAEEKPVAPTVKAKDDGSVTVTPPENAKEVSVTYTPEGAKDPVTVTATKGDDGNWTLPEGLDVTINPGTGVITIPADKVKDGTEVSAVAKDASGTASEETNDSKATAKTPRPDYADIYYPDTTIGVGDERKIYPIGYPGYVSTLPGDIDAPRGVYVRVNHDGSVDVEISPRYTGPSMFTITGYVDVDGKIAPISIRIRVIDDVRSDRRRQRMDKRDEMDKEDELIDTREVLTHKAYIFGYPDGTVRPNGFITRAEAAAMLSRLLEDENTASALKPAFSDTPSKWYNKAINAVVARGIMRGYSDGTFRPNAPITRAEFAQMISAIDAKPFGTAPFADVKGHWAELAIGKEYAAGRISGYPNGTFRPDAPITRAEAAHILNKIFERNYDLVSALQSNDKGNIKFFTDLSTSFWGYNDMIEATNTHTFRRRVKGMVQEDWDNINR